MLVVGGGFPLNPLSYAYIRTRLTDLQYLQHARVTPLCVIDLDDVDELEGLAEKGFSVADLLAQWQAADLRDVPLRNFILRQQIPDERRPTRMMAAVQKTFQGMVDRLRIRRDGSLPQ